MVDLPATLEGLCAGRSLDRAASEALFAAILRGEVEPVPLAGLLVAWKAKGATPAEVAGAATAMRAAATPFDPGRDVADCCGTGGDGAHTLNVSTAAALVAAEVGLPVAKHGNRSVSSRCGSADVLERCGVRVDAPPDVARRCLDALGTCFLFAPRFHPGVRHAMPVRRALGVRTLFNLLGPLCNPARPRWQLVGVWDPALCEVVAETLGLLGCERALVVHGAGLDEVAIHGPTRAGLLADGAVGLLELTPEDAGVARCPPEALRGGEPEENARALRDLLAGGGSPPFRDAAAVNAGALLWTAGFAADLRAGTDLALEALRSGRAAARLERLAALSQEASHGPG